MSYTNLLASVAMAALVAASPSFARDTIVGLSTQQTPTALQSQIERVIEHAVSTLEPEQSARFFDASNPRLVAEFTAPDGAGAGNPRAMLQANRSALGTLKRFIDSAAPEPGRIGYTNPPAFLRFVRKNYPAGEDGADLILLTSPIVDIANAPSLSTENGRVFNDGHIAARVGQSIYATTGLPGSLDGYDVYFGLIGAPWSVSEAHEYHVERAWALSVESHGASLAYFGEDLETLFRGAGRDVAPRVHPEPLAQTEKLEMLQFAPDTGAVSDIFTQPLEITPPPSTLWQAAQSPQIGITWDALDADVDLYIRPEPSAEVIYFGNATTEEGRLFKDFRNSPASGWETIQLEGVFDLSDMQIAVNFFGGDVPVSLTGEMRIAVGEQVWAAPFSLGALSGNGGKGAESVFQQGVVPNAAWTIIDPLAIVTGN